MGFTLREHTADVAVEATGEDLSAAFAAVAAGLTAAMCEEVPAGGERFGFEVRAGDRERLLFDYLDRLVYERDVREVLPTDHEAAVGRTSGGWRVEAGARGVPFGRVVARDVKAVTYSEMEVERTPEGWRAYVVFDV